MLDFLFGRKQTTTKKTVTKEVSFDQKIANLRKDIASKCEEDEKVENSYQKYADNAELASCKLCAKKPIMMVISGSLVEVGCFNRCKIFADGNSVEHARKNAVDYWNKVHKS